MTPRDYILNVVPSNPNSTDWILPEDDELLQDNRPFISRVLMPIQSNPHSYSRRKILPLDQGRVGSCVGMSGKVVLQDSEFHKDNDLSAMWIYKRGQLYDEWEGENYSGTSISGACEALRKEGVCLEKYYPYNPLLEDHPPLVGAYVDASLRKIDSYYFIPVERIEDVKRVLQTRSLWISFNVHEAFYNISSDGILRKEGYRESPLRGGHAVCVVGYKYIDGKLFWECQNSWGTTWGDGGYFWFEHELLKTCFSSGFYYLKNNSSDITFEEIRPPKKSFWENYGKYIISFGLFFTAVAAMFIISFL